MSNENVSLALAASPDKNKKMLHGLLKMPAFLPFVGLGKVRISRSFLPKLTR
ncbi:hypothetical protein [Klebsiella michiganensis]|uniref:hypothetical protein n=1 Tax=Klebsiella michiganensis TaxID=1134687 RepID=UPI000AF30092|nr:hypothetical protein [Klebsiella michiganensis]